MTTKLSSHELNQDTNYSKKSAPKGPASTTNKDKPTKAPISIVDQLAMPNGADIEFEPLTLPDKLCKPADLS